MDFVDNRGTITRDGLFWSVDNALVESVSSQNGRTGYIIVSYVNRGSDGTIFIETLRLNVTNSTIVINQAFRSVCLCDIRPGMWIDADFSPAMTRSIPPQTVALRIIVKSAPQPQPEPEGIIRIDRVIAVDARNNVFSTGVLGNINQQMRFNVTNDTVFRDVNGRRIQLSDLRVGQLVEVTHANFQTASIPPQTTAFRVQVLRN